MFVALDFWLFGFIGVGCGFGSCGAGIFGRGIVAFDGGSWQLECGCLALGVV